MSGTPSEAAIKAARKYLDSISGYEDPDTHTARHFDAFAADARREAQEEAARLIETHQETISSTSEGDSRHLTPRRHGNMAGLPYATAIRSLTPTKEGA